MKKVEATTSMVLSALYDMQMQETGATPAQLSKHLVADEKSVLAALRNLRDQRILRDVTRRGKKVWLLWSA